MMGDAVAAALPLRAGACPHSVARPMMFQDWEMLTFLHWRADPAAMQRLLPAGVEVDTFAGEAWVGLVPFVLRISPPGLPPVPYLTVFPETNVRTYVRGPDGRPGVLFLSLDAPRWAAVLGARATYHLPYRWAAMRVARAGDLIVYESRCLFSGRRPARSAIAIEVGPALAPAALGDLDHFLTARYRLYAGTARGIATAAVQHDPWTLRAARVAHLDEDLIAASGLPAPTGPPLAHYSARMRTRMGMLRAIPRGRP